MRTLLLVLALWSAAVLAAVLLVDALLAPTELDVRLREIREDRLADEPPELYV